MITPAQMKAARAMLGISQKDLARKAGVAVATLNNIERGAQTDPKISTLKAIRQALEKMGIEFTSSPLGDIGISLKPHKSSAHAATILIVDDSRTDRTLYRTWLQGSGRKYRIIEAESARAGFDAFMEHSPDCVVLDFMLYGADGFQLLAALKREQEKIPPILFITGMHNETLEANAKSQGVYCYLNKNKLTAIQLCNAASQALDDTGIPLRA